MIIKSKETKTKLAQNFKIDIRIIINCMTGTFFEIPKL